MKKKSKVLRGLDSLVANGQFWLLCLPALILLILFSYLPMYGLAFSFFDFSATKGLLHSSFVGFRWFEKFFSSVYFGRVLKNTVLLSLLTIVFSFPLPVVFALMLNAVIDKVFKRTAQTISYMPHFISTVIVVGIMQTLCAPDTGIFNRILMGLGITDEGINFFYRSEWFRFLYVASEVWQHCGWNAIIYLAALTSIDPELYDAAEIDGAGSWKKLTKVTLPSIVPTIVTMLILNLGSVMSVGHEKILLMYVPATYETADVISTFIYREGILSNNLGYGTAVGMFNSLVNLALIVFFNWLSKKIFEVGLW